MLEMAAIATECAPPRLDESISALATRQHGVVSRAQLRALGLSDGAIAHRSSVGRLHRVHHGVYAVGHAVLVARGRWMAGVLACAPGAVLSHASAAALWGLRASAATNVDVTVPGSGGRRRRPGLRVHRARSLDGETTLHDRIPVTTAARTILDLAAVLGRRPLERLLDQAEHTAVTDVSSLVALARAHAGHRGASRLLQTLDAHVPGTTVTRSELEELFLQLCRDSGLPTPRANAWVEGIEVDFLFARARLIVETDGWRHHRTREAFETDRGRDARLAAAGHRTLRFTYRQIADDRGAVQRALLAAYRGASAASSLA
jgi:very-short-patch-repair endonuclease/predicted transcriptional regulator of viral defense system